jgi:hypothetical protein
VAGIARNVIGGIVGGIQNIVSWVNDAISKVRALFDAAGKVAGAVGKALGFGGTSVTAEAHNYVSSNNMISSMGGAAIGATGGSTGGSSSWSRSSETMVIENNITIKVEATPGTDRVALGKELVDILKTYSRATGSKGGISIA